MRVPSARWWLLLAVVSAAGMAASLVVVVLTPVPMPPNVVLLGLSAFPVVGGLVVARQPANLVGRLLVAVGIWFSIGAAANTYLWWSLETSLPTVELAAWLAMWAYWPGAVLIPLIVAIFPSGRLASPWLKVPLRVGAAAVGLSTVLLLFLPVPVNTVYFSEDITNPWGIEALEPLSGLEFALPVLATALIAVVVTDLAVRWRRSAGVEQLQMRWVGLGFLTIALLAISGVLGEALGFTGFLPVLWLSFGVLPAAIGLAVLRYRLYEIDRIVSRTVSYAVVVGMLVTVFFGVVTLLSSLLPAESELAIAGSTLAVAALFNPVRRRVQGWVDRRFNRSHYDAQRVVDGFAGSLRDDVDTDQIIDGWMDAVAATMQPQALGIWVRR